ncbi:ribF [Acrasis kona]|uniref:RibF n=1 Tax=Acrasis kona TaxID=1008807 RepID=A0AAW2Z460_9EUKA
MPHNLLQRVVKPLTQTLKTVGLNVPSTMQKESNYPGVGKWSYKPTQIVSNTCDHMVNIQIKSGPLEWTTRKSVDQGFVAPLAKRNPKAFLADDARINEDENHYDFERMKNYISDQLNKNSDSTRTFSLVPIGKLETNTFYDTKLNNQTIDIITTSKQEFRVNMATPAKVVPKILMNQFLVKDATAFKMATVTKIGREDKTNIAPPSNKPVVLIRRKRSNVKNIEDKMSESQ